MTAMITEIERLRRELAAAEEELAAWRALTADDADLLTRRAHAIRAAYPRLPGHAPAMFLAALHSSTRPLTFASLDELIPPKQTTERQNGKAFINVMASHARRILGARAIVTHRAYGYSLSPEARAQLDCVICE